jgi:LysM repeat protein
MANLGIDYSWARPGAAAIKAAGYGFVCRYLGDDTTGKVLSGTEASSLLGDGINIVLVWEDEANAALQGEARGVQDATKALAQANALGVPSSVPLYFAVDFDEADTAATNGELEAYFDGVASVIGLARVGIYAGYYPIERLKAAGKVTYMWQTLAWSGGQIFSGCHIYQNGQSAFGSGADIDVAEQSSYGQWTSGSSVSSSAPAAPVAAPTPAAVAGPGGTYTVKSGDYLSTIGANLGVDWRSIAQLNGIGAPYTIYPNEVLHLPGGTTAPTAPAGAATIRYTVTSGETLTEIASKFNVSGGYETLAKLNNIPNPNEIAIGEVIVIPGTAPAATPAPAVKTYTVQSGEYLSEIGAKEGVDWHTIASLNHLAAPFTIYPNESLTI